MLFVQVEGLTAMTLTGVLSDERASCKRTVSGSNPLTGSILTRQNVHGFSLADLAC
jgi:hypothetical protein